MRHCAYIQSEGLWTVRISHQSLMISNATKWPCSAGVTSTSSPVSRKAGSPLPMWWHVHAQPLDGLLSQQQWPEPDGNHPEQQQDPPEEGQRCWSPAQSPPAAQRWPLRQTSVIRLSDLLMKKTQDEDTRGTKSPTRTQSHCDQSLHSWLLV